MFTLRFGLVLVLQVLLRPAEGYAWMSKIKAPSILNLRKMQKGSKFGEKKLVVITGTSSGLGKAATKALLRAGDYHVIGAVRDLEKMRIVAELEGFDLNSFTAMHLDLASFESELDGLELGCQKPIAMMDGYNFNGAKMYKEIQLVQTDACGTYEPPRKYFPIFMKYITGGYVGEEEAGSRLFQVLHDPKCTKSGVYWSWNGGPREGRGLEAMEKGGQITGAGGAGGGWESIYENDQSDKVHNKECLVGDQLILFKSPEFYRLILVGGVVLNMSCCPVVLTQGWLLD
eukprot:Skav235560  [mRNA]  locus=scaffold3067:354397:356823:- [translate_table: standard]